MCPFLYWTNPDHHTLSHVTGCNRPSETGTNVASPADKDGVNNCAEPIQPTNMRASEAPRSFTGKHICQFDSRGIVNYRSLSAGEATLDILTWLEKNLPAED